MSAVRAWIAVAAAALLSAGCITDPSGTVQGRADELEFSVIPVRPPTVYLASDVFSGHRRDAEMSALLEGQVRESLAEAGFRIADSPAEADYTLSTEVRAWWARSARFFLITLGTLTAYTPLDYKWILDVDLTDREGNPVGSTHERGEFRFETFGIVIFPATIYAYYELVVPHWKQIVGASGEKSADYLVRVTATGGAQPKSR